MRIPQGAYSWLTIAAVCFLLNALALTAAALHRDKPYLGSRG